jgi:hypothetical protein
MWPQAAENRREPGRKRPLVAPNWRCSPRCKVKWVNRWRLGKGIGTGGDQHRELLSELRKSEAESRIKAPKTRCR